MHEPVLVEEVISYLHITKDNRFIDATVGAGGHSKEILKRGGVVLGLDQDFQMLEVAQRNLEQLARPNFKLVKANFINIAQVAHNFGFEKVNGILFDLGISSLHYEWTDRGFSFNSPLANLDMRLDQNLAVTAADLLNTLRVDQLEQLFKLTVPNHAKRLSHRIAEFRLNKKFTKVADLLEVSQFLPSKPGKNPATVVFMALRIAVNSEIENIKIALPQAITLLVKGGALAVITFHSVEDKLVKNIFLDFENSSLAKIVTKKAVKPSEAEINKNPRARSARLRVLQKI